MKTKTMFAITLSMILITGITVCSASDYDAYRDTEKETTFHERRLNGPRLGVTYVLQHDALDRDGTFKARLEEAGMGNVISQFGWHFEWLVAPETGGPAFVTELLPFVGAVEYSKIVPSASLVFGIRMPQGFEFGMGPNVSTTFDPHDLIHTSLVIAAGYSLAFGDVSIPLNVALLTNKGGNRLSLVFGYAMPEKRKKY